ncbi:MAG: hypothetical protein JO033_13150 [Acidobacteriaceae bacterium]|nr:hypothetical protein [Acidobacteriaceae bacterium]
MRTLLLAICLSVIPAMADDIYTFTVTAAENVSSPAGSLTGWGYSMTNESSSLWLVTTGLIAGPLFHVTPTLLFDFPDLAPGRRSMFFMTRSHRPGSTRFFGIETRRQDS